ncbi:MAG: hypothetical protein G01um101491_110 [Parcubacteria group bacterium Gr01-1014_91]|nr:MAG: hypothetical protein G01um101491_110 [Parcubacteria group bacterium Gr01-1014_91]
MKSRTVLRLKMSLWFACMLLVLTPYAVILLGGAGFITNLILPLDSAEWRILIQVGLISLVFSYLLGGFAAFISQESKTADEKSLLERIDLIREIIRSLTFGLIG